MTYREIAALYKICRSTLYKYLGERKREVDQLASKYHFKDKTTVKRKLNRKQVKLIVEILQDTPEGYKLVRGTLVKLNDHD